MTPGRPSQVGEKRLRLSAPPDILATIPFLIGYHPTDSIVVLGKRERRVVFTARDDLLAAGDEALADHVDYLVGVVLRQGCDNVLLVGFGNEERVTPMLTALRDAYREAGVAVLEGLRAHEGRYWSYVCGNPSCCPPEGAVYDPNSSAAAAAWTLNGRVALRDRAEYEAQIQSASGDVRAVMQRATLAAQERLLAVMGEADDDDQAAAALLTAGNLAIAEALDQRLRGDPLTHDQVAWLTVLLMSIQVRDIAWSLIQGSGTVLFHHRALWQDVLHRAEPDLVPAPASLFAFAAWRSGDGGIARLALDRALDQDPRYRMAVMLHQAITSGLPPSALDGFPSAPLSRVRPRRRRRSKKVHVRTRRA
jgi:hypothetical protein